MATTTDGYQPFRPAWSATGNHRAAIQAAHDAGVKLAMANDTQFELNLGLYPWKVDGAIAIDNQFCRKVTGQGASVSFVAPGRSGFRIQQTPHRKPADYGKAYMCTISDINVYATPKLERVFDFDQENSADQENGTAQLERVMVRGGQYGHFTGANAFLQKAYGCQFFEQTIACIGVGDGPNSGEAVEFTDCTFHDAAWALRIANGVNKGVAIKGGSIDYLQNGVIDTMGGRVLIADTHVELRAMRSSDGNPSRYFNMDGGTNLMMRNANVSVTDVDGIPVPEVLFQIWGQGGCVTLEQCYESAWAHFDLSKVDAKGRPVICSDPDRLSFVRRLSEGGRAAMKGPKSWNYA